jgi:hypothetical protein
VVSYFAVDSGTHLPEDYDPLPKQVSFYNNRIHAAGYKPEGGASEMSKNQIEALKNVLGEKFPHVIYDAYSAISDQGSHENPHKICLGAKDGIESFVALDLEFGFQFLTRNKVPYTCQLDHLDPVVLPFDF